MSAPASRELRPETAGTVQPNESLDPQNASSADSSTGAHRKPISDPERAIPHESSSHDSPRGRGTSKPARVSQMQSHFREPLCMRRTDIFLLVCCFISGMLDASSVVAWQTFIGMQTGNTVWLGLGASRQPVGEPNVWTKALAAILSYLVGGFVFSRGLRLVSHRLHTRLALVCSFLAQTLLVVVAGALVSSGWVPIPEGLVAVPSDDVLGGLWAHEIAPICFLAFQAAGQVYLSRILPFPEVPTVVLTSLYCDLMTDARLFAWDNPKRTRRAIGAVLLLAGAISGGWFTRSDAGIGGAIWLAAALKAVLTVSCVFWPREEQQE